MREECRINLYDKKIDSTFDIGVCLFVIINTYLKISQNFKKRLTYQKQYFKMSVNIKNIFVI